jgi:hypothetical protein
MKMKPHIITTTVATSFTLGVWAMAVLPTQAIVTVTAGLATIAALTTLDYILKG